MIFKAHTEFLTFQLILNRDISFPKDMDEDCKDLIDRLVRLEPSERLGAGGVGGGMDKLMTHPYFKGIDFENLPNAKVPISDTFLQELKSKEAEEEKEMSHSVGFGGGSVYMSDEEE